MNSSRRPILVSALIEPEWAPESYYRLIKALVFLYPRVVVWAPNLPQMADYLPPDIFGLFESGVLVPAGRRPWFERTTGGRNDARRRARLHRIAEKQKVVLDANYTAGYRYLDRICQTESGRDLVTECGRAVCSNFSEVHRKTIEAVAEKHGWPLERGIANAIAQECVVRRKLGDAYVPVILPEFAPAYRVMQLSRWCRGNRRQAVERRVFEGFPKRLRENDVEKCVQYLMNSRDLSWKDALAFAKEFGESFRAFVASSPSEDILAIAQNYFLQVDKCASHGRQAAIVALCALIPWLAEFAGVHCISTSVAMLLGASLHSLTNGSDNAKIDIQRVGSHLGKFVDQSEYQFLLRTPAWMQRSWRSFA